MVWWRSLSVVQCCLSYLTPLCGSQFHDLKLNDWKMWSFSNLKLTFEKTREKPWSEHDHTNMISNGQVASRWILSASRMRAYVSLKWSIPLQLGWLCREKGLQGYLENMFFSWPGYSYLMKCFIIRSIVFLDWGCRHGLADYRWICWLTVSLICVFEFTLFVVWVACVVAKVRPRLFAFISLYPCPCAMLFFKAGGLHVLDGHESSYGL